MLSISFCSFYAAVIVFPLFACGYRRGYSVVEQTTDVEHDLSIPVGPTVLSRNGRKVNGDTAHSNSRFRKEKNKFVSAEYADNMNNLLHYLYRSREYIGKRESEPKQQVLKCLQQPSNDIRCFGKGKFYQFMGSLDALSPVRLSEMIRESEGGEDVRGRNADLQSPVSGQDEFRLWKKRSSDWSSGISDKASKSYQEVVMDSHAVVTGPRTCYGFVAPSNVVHKPKSKSQRGLCPCGGHGSGGCATRARNRRLDNGNQAHTIWKRSAFRTVACRPLYVPTPKPSVNEGRIAKCRLPCGAHNCLLVPTCPCFPSRRTPAPPASTCAPEPPCCRSSIPPIPPTRCPPYNITEEPCPTFSECIKLCPFFTTPHCPICSKAAGGCGCSKNGACSLKSPQDSSASTDIPNTDAGTTEVSVTDLGKTDQISTEAASTEMTETEPTRMEGCRLTASSVETGSTKVEGCRLTASSAETGSTKVEGCRLTASTAETGSTKVEGCRLTASSAETGSTKVEGCRLTASSAETETTKVEGCRLTASSAETGSTKVEGCRLTASSAETEVSVGESSAETEASVTASSAETETSLPARTDVCTCTCGGNQLATTPTPQPGICACQAKAVVSAKTVAAIMGVSVRSQPATSITVAVTTSRTTSSVVPSKGTGSGKLLSAKKKERITAEPFKVISRKLVLWPSFDLMKLLKQAPIQTKDKGDQIEPIRIV